MELLYARPDGGEHNFWVIDFDSTFSVSTYVGDRWRLRSRRGLLLLEFVVAPGCPSVTLAPCVPDDMPPPAAPQLPAGAAWDGAARGGACGATELLGDVATPGQHLLCLWAPPAPSAAAFYVAAFAGAIDGGGGGGAPVASHSFAVARGADGAPPAVDAVVALVLGELERVFHPPPKQPPALFTRAGRRIVDGAELATLAARGEGVWLYEGGQWLWPAPRVGYAHVIRVGDGEGGGGEGDGGGAATVRLVVRSLRPRVLEVESFLSDGEAAQMISLSEPHMHTSGVSMKAVDAKAGHADNEYRTSSQHSLGPTDTDDLLALSRRVQRLTRIPITHTEQIQVLRYHPWQHYTSHHDFFDPGDYGKSAAQKARDLASNRLATVFFYLTEVAEGGETGFPRAGGLSQPHDFLDCKRGLSVRPQKRKVVIFYSMLSSGEFDHYSLHTGCDVKNGTKWAANYWLWNVPQFRWSSRLAGMAEELAQVS